MQPAIGWARDSNSPTPGRVMNEPLVALELERVTKTYGGVRVLSDVDLTCLAGEVHALVGENGAGKSTLMKIAAGAVRPDSGSVSITGERLSPSPRRARALGLFTAYQDTALIPHLTVAENVMLSFVGLPHPRMRLREAEIVGLLERFDLPCAPRDVVGSLSPGARQLLEVARILIHNPRVLLLDEPTAALDAGAIGKLEDLVRGATAQGAAVLYVSHRLDEVERIADRLTVIRDGKLEGTYTDRRWSAEEIVAKMVGRRIDLTFPPKPQAPSTSEAVLETQDFRGHRFGPISLIVRRGEIVGVAGAEGNGQRPLLRTIVGLREGEGTVRVAGHETRLRTPREAVEHGICFLSGDRAAESTFAELSVMENGTIGSRGFVGEVGLVLRSRERGSFARVAGELGIVRASPDQPIGQLSGGNQQKAVLSRSFHGPWTALVIDEPTQGVDARSRLDIYRSLRAQADSGAGILVNSSDAAELAGVCDRVYVLSRGRVVEELRGTQLTEATIVDRFVNAGSAARATQVAGARDTARAGLRRLKPSLGAHWTPMAILAVMMLALGFYTGLRNSLFLTSGNLSSLLIVGLPLFAVAIGQQAVLVAGGFDISVGSTISLTVVAASFSVTQASLGGAVPGVLECLAIGLGIGVLNWFIVRVLKVGAIIGTIGTLGMLAGLAIVLRPNPGGTIGLGLVNALSEQVGFVPVAFIVVVGVAATAECWLRATMSGLAVRAAGYSEEAARRVGIRVEAVKLGAYIVCGVLAVVAGLLLSVQVGLGQNDVGSGFALPALTACFLGGAVLTGGDGSFLGALLGALFLSLLTNVIPLIGLPDATSGVFTGGLTILAIMLYASNQGAEHGLGSVLRRIARRARATQGGSATGRPSPESVTEG
jgi:ribose transport system ATP-binding protein